MKCNRLAAWIAALLIALLPIAHAAAPAEAAQAATPVPPAGAGQDVGAQKEVVENPYGLEALWKGGDFVSRGTLIILVIMSMGSWYIMVTKFIDQFRMMGQAKEASTKFWKSSSVQAGIGTLKAGSPFRFIAESANSSTEHHEGALL